MADDVSSLSWDRDYFASLRLSYRELIAFLRENPIVSKVLSNVALPSQCLGYSTLLLKSCDDEQTQFAILSKLVEAEFEFACSDFTTFMRERSRIPNRATGDFVLLNGKKFLVNLLRTNVSEIMSSRTRMEIDPEKRPRKLEQNKQLLIVKTNEMLEHIFSQESARNMPPQIRALAHEIRRQAPKYGLDCHQRILAGNLLVLRFICPAIAIPEFYGVALPGKTPGDRARRNLILITKIVQCIANDSVPGSKEDYMAFLAPFIEGWIPRFKEWLDLVCEDPDGDNWGRYKLGITPVNPASIPIQNFDLRSLASVHRALVQFREQILTGIDSEPDQYDALDFRTRFDGLLLKLGTPPIVAPLPYLHVDRSDPKPKHYRLVKINRKGKRQDRVVKFTTSSLINIEQSQKHSGLIKNEVCGGDISIISAPKTKPLITLAFLPGKSGTAAPGVFISEKRDRGPRTYECPTIRARDEILGEILELCFRAARASDTTISSVDPPAVLPPAFKVIKVNRHGKSQSRVFKLTKDSLLNLDGSKIKTETHFASFEYSRPDEEDPKCFWFKVRGEEDPRRNMAASESEREELLSMFCEGIGHYL
eukprot:gnl/Dysnectes_brevis/3644_a4648_843.p1 GENE.gnl/Dysnectes_brevis/3644_a4648_843~~gnl/Dysnectes_brevis/3644_a4648_843.p1  ORF type:complete len:593 (-),score=173.14 gnl/Dysnectes_brevis/3644_a4648_843:589-2367(-)